MPLAAFIVVTMGLMALTLSRNTAQTSIATTQEGISLQAFYAAESGAQWGANQLFYNVSAELERIVVDDACIKMTGGSNPGDITFTVAGLNGCEAEVRCACSFSDGTGCTATAGADYDGSGRYQSFYTITSRASCGSGEVDSIRAIVISGFLED